VYLLFVIWNFWSEFSLKNHQKHQRQQKKIGKNIHVCDQRAYSYSICLCDETMHWQYARAIRASCSHTVRVLSLSLSLSLFSVFVRALQTSERERVSSPKKTTTNEQKKIFKSHAWSERVESSRASSLSVSLSFSLAFSFVVVSLRAVVKEERSLSLSLNSLI
jgi:hypothetical protein